MLKTIKAVIKFYTDLWHDTEKAVDRRRELEKNGLERIKDLEEKVKHLMENNARS